MLLITFDWNKIRSIYFRIYLHREKKILYIYIYTFFYSEGQHTLLFIYFITTELIWLCNFIQYIMTNEKFGYFTMCTYIYYFWILLLKILKAITVPWRRFCIAVKPPEAWLLLATRSAYSFWQYETISSMELALVIFSPVWNCSECIIKYPFLPLLVSRYNS